MVSLQTAFQVGLCCLKRCRVTIKVYQGIDMLGMNIVQCGVEILSEGCRRSPSNNTGQVCMRPFFDPYRPVAYLKMVEGLVLRGAERIPHKTLNRRQHAGNHMLILHHCRVNSHVVQEKSRLPMDEKHLFHPISQRMKKHDLRERFSCMPGFHSPAKAANGQALVQRLIEGLHHTS